MEAPEKIRKVWDKFKYYPMETLTKVWYSKQERVNYQRTVAQMEEHYEKYRITGNCFDLAIWLLHELEENKINAYVIGHDLFTEEAHIAVIALDDNNYKYLCDLGDQWIQPICIDSISPKFHSNECHHFFPGAIIEVHPQEEQIEIDYKRSNGKVSKQLFDLQPISKETLLKAAEFSQRFIKPNPLVECRLYEEEVIHWEFYNFESFSSSMNGLVKEEELTTISEWAKRIHERTGYEYSILLEVLQYYQTNAFNRQSE